MRGDPAPHSLVVVDEAGQIGGKQMHDLLRVVRTIGGRLILSGDTRQHGPVEACDALVAIERYSGIQPVGLHTIRRQDPRLAKSNAERRRIAAYRDAVAAAPDRPPDSTPDVETATAATATVSGRRG